jgi:hypothetical protein
LVKFVNWSLGLLALGPSFWCVWYKYMYALQIFNDPRLDIHEQLDL